jgi:hypothetical protein
MPVYYTCASLLWFPGWVANPALVSVGIIGQCHSPGLRRRFSSISSPPATAVGEIASSRLPWGSCQQVQNKQQSGPAGYERFYGFSGRVLQPGGQRNNIEKEIKSPRSQGVQVVTRGCLDITIYMSWMTLLHARTHITGINTHGFHNPRELG